MKKAIGKAMIASVTVTRSAVRTVRQMISRYTGTLTSSSKFPS